MKTNMARRKTYTKVIKDNQIREDQITREEAIRLGNDYLGSEHLFLGILRDAEGVAIELLLSFEIELIELKTKIEKEITQNSKINEILVENLTLLKSADKALKLVHLEARSFNCDTIDTGHLLLAILKAAIVAIVDAAILIKLLPISIKPIKCSQVFSSY